MSISDPLSIELEPAPEAAADLVAKSPYAAPAHDAAASSERPLANAGLRNGLALFDQALVSGTRFLTTIIIGRVCGPSELGIYSLAFAPLLLIACAQEALLSQPYTVYGNRQQGRKRKTLAGSVLAHYFVIALLAMVALGAVSAVLHLGFGPPQLAPTLLILVAVVPFALLWELGRRFSYAHLNLAAAVAMDLTVAVVQIGGILLLAWFGWLNIKTIFLMVGLACGMVGVSWLFLSRKSFVLQRQNVLQDWKNNWSLGRWLAASQIVGLVHGYAMLWVLALWVGALATGIFAACESIVLLSNPIILGIGNLLGAETALAYAQGGKAKVRQVTGRAVVGLVATMALLCVVLFVASEQLIWLLYGAQFQGQGGILRVLAACTPAWAATTAFSMGLTAMERSDVIFRGTLFGLVVTLLLAIPLISHWETLGAAWALLGGSFASTAWQGLAFSLLTREQESHA